MVVESLSLIVIVAIAGEPSEAPLPVGLLSVIRKVSVPSRYLSSTIGITMFFAVSLAAKRRVPIVAR